ncbi:MAG: phage portal protein [Psychrilyobacter sp.]|uniref:phage portal protein n=1 Tax=Psychrilyobacter sp. TaxID=2586924 RepID=UPI003C7854DA
MKTIINRAIKAIKAKFSPKNEETTLSDPNVRTVLKTLGINPDSIDNSSDMSETIYYICLKHMAETMSKMPWEKRIRTKKKGKERDFDSSLDFILNVRPNPYYSASTFWAAIELNKLHYGNSYAYIETDRNGAVKHLWVLPSDQVEVWMDDKGIIGQQNAMWYIWTDPKTCKRYTFLMGEILHFKTMISFNALVGIPVKEYLKTQINTGKNSIGFLNKLYKNNMFGSKVIVHYTGELSKKAEASVATSLENFSKSQGSGKFIPMPMGMQAQLLDMKLADAQFFENNKVSALQLAAAFGIKPNVINNYDKSSYSNSESQQLDFYVNSLQPLFNNYHQELSYKLLGPEELKKGCRLEINEKILFKMDNTTQAEVYNKYLSMFAMTPNEVREELNLPYKDGGDILIGNGNAIGLEDVGKQYKKGGE